MTIFSREGLPALACLCKTLTGKQKAKDASGGPPDATGGSQVLPTKRNASLNVMSKNKQVIFYFTTRGF
jgi:hypothetical protein